MHAISSACLIILTVYPCQVLQHMSCKGISSKCVAHDNDLIFFAHTSFPAQSSGPAAIAPLLGFQRNHRSGIAHDMMLVIHGDGLG